MKTMLTGFFLSLLCFTLCGQVTLDNVMNAPFPTNLVESADGTRIAWVFNEQGVRNIYGAEAPDFKTKKLTQNTIEDGQDINSLVFSATGNLVFVAGGPPNAQNEIPNPRALKENIEQAIWSLHWSGELRKVGKGSHPKVAPDGKKVAFISGGQVHIATLIAAEESKKMFHSRGMQGSLRWSPDGRQLAFISSRGDHSFLGVYDLGSGAVKFLDPSVDFDSNPVWSEDGGQLAFIRKPNVSGDFPFIPKREAAPWSIRVVNVASGTASEVWRAPAGKGSALFEFVPAVDNFLFWIGSKIIFPWERTGWIHLYAVSASGGTPLEITPGDGEVEHISLAHDKKSLLVVSNITDIDRRHIWKVFPFTNKPQQLSKGTGIEWSEAETTQGIACLRSDATTVAWPHLILADGKMKMLAPELFPKEYPKTLVTPQAVQITATDGMKIPGQLFLPPNYKASEKHPAVIFFHGGSRRQMLLGFNYGQYYHHAYSFNQYLASQGYIVLSVNYRSGIGYGLDFREAENYGAGGASEFNDVMGAGIFLQQRADVDARRIGLWGGSYGGFLTALGLARASYLFACGVDIHGVHDWNVVIKNFSPRYDPQSNHEVSKRAFESSPMNFMEGWKSPVLLIHGDDDRNVPFSESVTLSEQLRKQNVYFEQLVFPDEVHSFLLYKSWYNAYAAAARFLAQEFKKVK